MSWVLCVCGREREKGEEVGVGGEEREGRGGAGEEGGDFTTETCRFLISKHGVKKQVFFKQHFFPRKCKWLQVALAHVTCNCHLQTSVSCIHLCVQKQWSERQQPQDWGLPQT